MANKDIVSEYADANIEARVNIIIKYYPSFEELLLGCEECLNIVIREERDYKWQSARDELGVRVQTSKISDPTAKTAISNVTIENAVKECDLAELEKELDEEIAREYASEVKMIKDMKEDIGIFRKMFRYLPPDEAVSFEKYLVYGRKTEKLAEELSMSPEALRMKMSEFKKTVFAQTVNYLERKYQFRGGRKECRTKG